jgi:hypothetical protein
MTTTNKSDISIQELVNQIERKELMLPKMQRRYVWRATRVRDLLDSLYRGYPSGSILVWDNYTPELSRGLDVEQTSSSFNSKKLLLDGQQRLTSLSAVLRGALVSVRGRKKPIDILFNLDHPDGLQEFTEVEDDEPDSEDTPDEQDEEQESVIDRLRNRTFVVASKSLAQMPNWISVTDVFKSSDINSFLLRLGITSLSDPRVSKYTQRIQALQNIRNYVFTVNTISRNISYEEVAEIFVRVNSLGVKLRGSDLALALITAKWPESLDLLEKFQEECEERFTTFDLGLLVRAMVVFATKQSRFLTVSNISVQDLKEGWEKAQSGLLFAMNFLQENCGINDEALLSSPMIYLLIAYYSQLKDERLTTEENHALQYWVYMASAWSRYSRSSNETALDADMRSVEKENGLKHLLENLRQQVGRFDFTPTDFMGRTINSGIFSLMFLTLKAKGAVDWSTGLGISTRLHGNQHKIEFHHIFPKALLKKDYDKQQINDIANLAFISGRTNQRLGKKSPAEYLKTIVSEKGAATLENQCVPLDPALHSVENYPQFLAARREALANALNEFTGRVKPGWV